MKDCFGSPQAKGEGVEVFPRVFIVPDTEEDISNMCALLYGVYHMKSKEMNFAYLKTMVRMGEKYKICYFQETALCHLRRLFPRDWARWNQNHSTTSKTCAKSPGILFEVINLAYEYSIYSILPAAFMCLFKVYPLCDIISGCKLADGSVVKLSSPAFETAISGRTTFTSTLLQCLRRSLGDEDSDNKFSIPSKEFCAIAMLSPCRSAMCHNT
ncbi:hypothetical protein HYPSUDRAFT_47472 [Hypholoma sublateritium FD-334 SS-4]|uniref:BTB domain-containing protein n=1 Tax=Hypholoma sublateritium (strain FD-334 SS-4) TaxID=945553 RepID=A0A0D2NAU1_HYPSF|nr:hypothetical protein HYPSUDRAFT_47472 [Hypholoma sublateritium FD-334 SS-4]